MTRPLTPQAAFLGIATDIRSIMDALSARHGNVTSAAADLGINRRTLDRRITEYGLRDWLQREYPRSVRQPGRRVK